jgi:U3 small nucleolar ribonucleoprotein protein IMP4
MTAVLLLPAAFHRGEPDGMVVCHLPYGPTAYFGVFNTVLRHDIGQKKEVGTISEAYPHLIFEKFTSPLGQRLANILKHLFPVPKDDTKRLVTFANAEDYVSFRHHIYSTPRGSSSIELTEVSSRAAFLVMQPLVQGRQVGSKVSACS